MSQSTIPVPGQPHYGAPPLAAIRRFFSQYARFRGRASRAEYWWIILAGTLLNLALQLIDGSEPGLQLSFTPFRSGELDFATPWVAVLAGAIALGTLVPSLALVWRRLHDVNRSGMWIFALFIPIAGAVFLLILFVLPPRPEGMRFD